MQHRAAGLQLNWRKVTGLCEALGKSGVTSNYSFRFAPYTWECIRNFKGGNALFTQILLDEAAPMTGLPLSQAAATDGLDCGEIRADLTPSAARSIQPLPGQPQPRAHGRSNGRAREKFMNLPTEMRRVSPT